MTAHVKDDRETVEVFAKRSPLPRVAVEALVGKLVTKSKRLHRVCEDDCNDGGNPGREKLEKRLLAEVQTLVETLVPGAKVNYQGDPRGYVVRVQFPKMHEKDFPPSNTWGNDGWGIR
jgi:hypothetical protein